jgi:hypothetical protein
LYGSGPIIASWAILSASWAILSRRSGPSRYYSAGVRHRFVQGCLFVAMMGLKHWGGGLLGPFEVTGCSLPMGNVGDIYTDTVTVLGSSRSESYHKLLWFSSH